MIVNFKIREINQGTHKLIRTFILIIIIKKYITQGLNFQERNPKHLR
jgi:hypothetical protein